ncbi:MAG: hypothetical protein KGI00_04975 [Candidatus Micrarchaeota archaeon]|nr:hypothetical protein [Candidatus Micrarchaeota archaeon]
MPYDIRKTKEGYEVINQITGESKGVSKTRPKAEAHMRALYAHEPKDSNPVPGMRSGGFGLILDDTYQPRPITEVYVDGKKHIVDRNASDQGQSTKQATSKGQSKPPVGVADEDEDEDKSAFSTLKAGPEGGSGKGKGGAPAVEKSAGKSTHVKPRPVSGKTGPDRDQNVARVRGGLPPAKGKTGQPKGVEHFKHGGVLAVDKTGDGKPALKKNTTVNRADPHVPASKEQGHLDISGFKKGGKMTFTKEKDKTKQQAPSQNDILAANMASQGAMMPPPPMALGGSLLSRLRKYKKGGKFFIQKAIKRPGQLHRDLGVPEDESIPESKLEAAASRGGKVGQRARFAETLKGLRPKKTK